MVKTQMSYQGSGWINISLKIGDNFSDKYGGWNVPGAFSHIQKHQAKQSNAVL